METPNTEKVFLLILLVIALGLTLAILFPFLTTIIIAASFTVVLNPVYQWIKSRITRNRSGWASIITVIIFIVLLGIPIFFVGSVIFNQAQNAYKIISETGSSSAIIQKIDISINRFLPSDFNINIYEKINNIASFLSNNIGKFFTATLNTVILSILTIFTMFYMFKNGEQWREGLIRLIPLSERNIREILAKLNESITRILRGSFIIAIVQGILAWIGLWIFGVPNPALWGVVAGMASFVPTIGTSIVTVPAILYLFFSGMHLHALGLLIWSMLVVGTIDNILSPYIISKNSDIPPIFILFAILGGISLMGPVGIIIGPLVVSFLYSVVAIYKK